MDPSIEKIIRNQQVDSIFHTHVSMIQPKTKYQFTRQDLETFWEVYSKRIQEEPNCVVGIAEKAQHYLPVLADVDLDTQNIEFTVEQNVNADVMTSSFFFKFNDFKLK